MTRFLNHRGCESDSVIPGRCEASNPESRDSGSGANAPSRNDDATENPKEDTDVDASSPKDLHYYEPRNGHGLRHDPFNAIIAPRPIRWISSRDAKGNVNLAPYSFFHRFL